MPALVIAHRTCPLHAPENSLEGIRRAAELGADAVEIDIRRTLDGVPILMHDWNFWRMARFPWPVRLLPHAIVRLLRLRDSSERVPSLAEALAALPSGLMVAIDIKDASAAAPAVSEVRRRGLEGRTLLWSQHAAALAYTAGEAPEMESSLLRDARSPGELRRFLDDAVRLGARGISAFWEAVTEEFIAEAHGLGLRVYSWNRRGQAVGPKLAMGLDGVVTDWPDEVRAVIASGE